MRTILTVLMMTFLVQTVSAQAPKRRVQPKNAATANSGTSANGMTTRAQIAFPTETKMSEDVTWRRDVYRELDLTDDANSGLYYPVEPVGTQMNLFTYMFKLMMRGASRGGIDAYEYTLDGNENFTDSAKIRPLKFLDDYHIYYERTDRGIRLDNSDIPSAEVKGYYIKESAYYDQVTSTFHTKVQAICPILSREDDFGGKATKYPLFWVKYEDIAPFLAKQTIMTSNLNNAATMSVDDYFTLNKYKGKIYKTNNMLGKTLAQEALGKAGNVDEMDEKLTDSLLVREQNRIEKQIKDFETNIWGDKSRKDSLDSIAKLDPKEQKAVKKKNRREAAASGKTTVKKQRTSTRSASSGSSARVTVRRQRH